MSGKCTPAEIAEKKRIALEKLKQRQAQQQKPQVPTPASNNVPKPPPVQAWKRPLPNSVSPQDNKKAKIEPAPTLAPVFRKVVSCTCSLVSDTRFMVTANGFHDKMITIFKSITSKQYDTKTRDWTFDLKDYQLLQDRVAQNLHPDVTIGQIPKFVFKTLEIPKVQMRPEWLSALEPGLVNTLMDFQKEGVCFGIAKGGRCLIADDMGLGKTLQALGIADFYKEDWPMLICTTATARDMWCAKVRELLPYVACHNIVVMTGKNDYIAEAKVLITSYPLMEKQIETLLEFRFGVLIMDESHALKNFKTKSTAAARQLAQQARRIILLTGTPALSRPVELFTQLEMIDPLYVKFKEYSARYCAGRKTNFGWDSSGQSNLQELNVILSRKFMIRRIKADVLAELAEKSRETVVLDPTLVWTNKESGDNLKSYAADLQKYKGREREEILLRFYAITAEVKVKAVCEYVKSIVRTRTKFIIFAHHQVMLNALTDCLNKQQLDFIRIDGQTRTDLRNDFVNRFQTKDECRAAVLSLKACNSAITLTAASLVLFAELDWNPSTLTQAESRAHRIGQESAVTVRYLMAKGTADDVIWEMLKSKQSVLNKAGLCSEDFGDSSNAVVAGPSTNHKIDSYFKASEGGGTTNGSTAETSPAKKLSPVKANADIRAFFTPEKANNAKNEFQAMLDDDDDDFLLNI